MKRFLNIQFISVLLSCSFIITFTLVSCNQKKEKSEVTTPQNKSNNDTLVQQTYEQKQDNSPKAEPAQNSTPTVAGSGNEPAATGKPATPKICNPNFNLLASPKKNQKIYYVSGFNPGEFKCWEELESQGRKLCGDSPCVIYYVDKANANATSTPPNYLDANTLKTNGIGRFEYDGKSWELKGSTIWGRTDKGYAYYNTNNAGGG